MRDENTKASYFPTVPKDLSTIVKPEELVDIVEMSPLTLQDRRIYNLLIGNAWNHIIQQKHHVISRSELTRHVDSNNQDIAASLRRLMSAIVVIKIRNNRNGKPSTRQIQLLAENDIEDRGPITYKFPDALVKIIQNTQIFARLHTKVMFELSSKYSLALYEFLQKRKHMAYLDHEILTVDEVRGLLGVGPNKLKAFGHLNDKAIKPAVSEVSFLTEYDITAEPIRKGRSVVAVKFQWQRKSDVGAQIAAVEELERSKTGRKSRMKQTTQTLLPLTFSQKGDFTISAKTREAAKVLAVNADSGWDVPDLERAFYEYADRKGAPDNPDGAFIGFVRKKIADKA